MVEVVVDGEDDSPKKSFFVHRELLTSRSCFFAKALKNYAKSNQREESGKSDDSLTGSIQWREGENGVVTLPVDDPDVFANYIQLLYTGVLPVQDDPKKPVSDDQLSEEKAKEAKVECMIAMAVAAKLEFAILGKLYVFCEKIQDADAKYALLAGFIEATKIRDDNCMHFCNIPIIGLIYAGTLTFDPIRDFLVDCCVLRGTINWVNAEYKSFLHEFLFDVMKGMYKDRARPDDRSRVEDAKHYQDKLLKSEEKVAGDAGKVTE
jgi:hypothetical protein